MSLNIVMTLQNIFYSVAIVYMVLSIVLFIAGIVLLFYIKTKLTTLYETIDEKVTMAKEIVSHPTEIAAGIGESVANAAIQGIARIVGSRKHRHAT